MAGIADILKLREQTLLGQGIPANIGQPYALPPPNPMDTGGSTGSGMPSQSAVSPPRVASPVFSGQRVDDTAPPFQTQAPQEPESDIERLIKMFRPETAATGRFEDLMANQPKYENPSLGRKLVAMGVGVKGGIDTMDKVLDQPFNRSTEMWKSKIDPAYQAANLERYSNANERQAMNSLIASNTWDKRLAAAETIAARKAEADMINARARQFAAENQDWKWDLSGTTVKLLNPQGQPVVTNIPTDKLDELTRITLQNAGRVAAAQALGTQVFNDPASGGVVRLPVRTPGATTEPVLDAQGNPQKTLTTPPATPSTLIQGVKPEDLAKLRQSASETLETVNLLMDDKGNLYPAVQAIVGGTRLNPFSGGARFIPGTETATAQINYDNLKARQIIDLIEEMKAQSRTGATGFGQLTGKELEVLQAAASRLNVKSTEADFVREMKLIKEKLLLILQPGPGEGNTAAAPADPNLTDVQRRAAEILRQKDPRLVTPANIDAFIKANGFK